MYGTMEVINLVFEGIIFSLNTGKLKVHCITHIEIKFALFYYIRFFIYRGFLSEEECDHLISQVQTTRFLHFLYPLTQLTF